MCIYYLQHFCILSTNCNIANFYMCKNLKEKNQHILINCNGIRSLVPHLIGPPSHRSPSHWSPNSLVPQYIIGVHWYPISLVPNITGPLFIPHPIIGQSQWSPISLVPHLIGSPSHWSPNSSVPPSHWSPNVTLSALFSLVPHLIGTNENRVERVTRGANGNGAIEFKQCSGDLWIGGPAGEKGPMGWGTNEMEDQWVGGTNETGDQWNEWCMGANGGINEMGDQWEGGPMRWGTNEMGDQWDGGPMMCTHCNKCTVLPSCQNHQEPSPKMRMINTCIHTSLGKYVSPCHHCSTKW